jgi:hypothetical protein
MYAASEFSAFIAMSSHIINLHSENADNSATAPGMKSGRNGTVTASYVNVAKYAIHHSAELRA